MEVSSFHCTIILPPPSVQPATVSRCGMIYLEPSTFGWRPIFTSWLLQLPPALADHTPLITSLVDWLVVPCLDLVQRQLKGEVLTIPLHHSYVIITSLELVATSESNLTRSLMYMFDMMMSSALEDEKAVKDKNFRVWIVVCIYR